MAGARDFELHPWNTSFTWRDRSGPFRTLTRAQVEQFDRDGFFVIPQALDPATLQRTRAELDAIEAATDALLQTTDDGRIFISETGALTFSPHLVARSRSLRALSSHAVFVDVCRDLVGPDVRLYWDQAVYKKPEKPRRFPWHQDNGYTFVEPQDYLTCWVALTDATDQNGCPHVAPGVHRQGTLRHRFVEPLGWECFEHHPDSVVVEVPAGGMAVFSSLTPHLTGPNTTAGVRKAYILQYAPDGAVVLMGDPRAGPPTDRVPCTHADRQYPVLRDGSPVGPQPD